MFLKHGKGAPYSDVNAFSSCSHFKILMRQFVHNFHTLFFITLVFFFGFY